MPQEQIISQASFVSKVDVTVLIAAPPARVVRAFFDRSAIAAWWQAIGSVTIPRTLGPYVIEWRATDFEDDILGRLGGTLRGTVMQVDPAEGFFLADVYWLPPDSDPVGPMALEISCRPAPADLARSEEGDITQLRVLQTGFEEGARWRRYYAVFGAGWERALATLKGLLER